MNQLTSHQSNALNYHNHISLTANAGSGKTFVVSKRFVEIALKENIPLSKIAAITFTDKAASELYKKISECIEDLILKAEDNSEVKLLENIRRQLISANIATIHSFCMNILKEFPVEAELDANIVPIDGKLSSEIIERSVDRMIKESLDNEDKERIKKLIRMFSSKSVLAGEMESLVKNYVRIFLLEDKIYSKSNEEIIQQFNKIIFEYFEKLIRNDLANIINNLNKINDVILADKSDNIIALNASVFIKKLNSQLQINELLEILLSIKRIISTKNGAIITKGYLKSALKNNVFKEYEEIELLFTKINIFDINQNQKEIWRELSLFGKEIIYFFRISLTIYEESKSENGYLDYEDILYKTYYLLKNPNVREYLGNKYRYLMIDEYQDTNELQYNIFLPLLDNLKRGNLFVVGDEKQSIYMFRDAELEVFRKTNEDIAGISGLKSLLKLPDSFRMKQELCCFTNILFKKLFAIPDSSYNEVEHSDIICASNEDDHAQIEILYNQTGNQYGNTESDLLVKRLINLVDCETGKYQWGDIAVLCKKRKYFSELEKKFAEYKVPFIIMGGKEFYQRQSIYDIYNYFSFLLENNNDTALIGLLQSPFFAFSYHDIYKLSLKDGVNYWKKLEKIKYEDPKWAKAYALLNENILLSVDIDFSLLLRKILRESPFLTIMAARTDGTQEVANIEKLISLTSDFMKEGYKTLYDFINYLKFSIEEKHDEPQASISEESNAIKIMTLHQSKGLEFPVIVLYKSNDTVKTNNIKSKTILADKTFGLLTKIPLQNNYFIPYQSSSINYLRDYIAEKKENAETKRLLYVGVTRAKEHLIISFESKEDLKLQYGSFIWMLKKGLDIDFEKDLFRTRGKLTFLAIEEGNYFDKEKMVPVNIPIIKDIQLINPPKFESLPLTRKKVKIRVIEDHLSGDIVSATKYSVFSQCPLKYFFRFEVGLKLTDTDFDLHNKNITGPENESDSQLKGRIIHALLEEEIDQKGLYEKTRIILDKEKISPDRGKKIFDNILNDLGEYLSSEKYKKINAFEKYKNEYEIYFKMDKFYLYGRIDKVIFTENEIKIIDYKTDNIIPQNINSKQYYSQVKFYSYILSKLFPQIQKFEMQIVYIKNPDTDIQFKINKEDFSVIEDEINNMIQSLRIRRYISKIDHCKECVYSVNKIKCIKKQIFPMNDPIIISNG
jgi:ATP-dependent helicase/nuclease subunit A